MRLPVRLAILAPLFLVFACGDGTPSAARRGVQARVTAASEPARVLARMALPAEIEVVAPIRADLDHRHEAPSRAALAELRDARMIVLTGAGFEAWANGASLPPSRTVRAAAGTESLWIEVETTTHTHGNGEEHTHGGHDPHVWLDPVARVSMLEAIRESALEAFPEHAAAFGEVSWPAGTRHADGLAEPPLLVVGDALAYLAPAIGRRVLEIRVDPFADEVELSTTALRQLEQLAPTSKALLVWPCAPPTDIAGRLQAELSLNSVSFDALLRPNPGVPDTERIERALTTLNIALDATR